jgi:hypothetical protein
MNKLWLLRADHDAPGWRQVESEAKSGALDWRLLDRDAFVLVLSADPPKAYDGFTVTVPADGVYLDQQGHPLYVVAQQEVSGPVPVIKALGPEAEALLDKLGDGDTVLDRLGRAY